MKYQDKTTIPATTAPPKARWEYRSQKMEVGADLAQFGEEGWELVSVTSVQHDPSQAVFYFKRRR